MGIVCTFLRVSIDTVQYLLENPELTDDYLGDNYASIDGKFHREGDTVFYTDKAWDIALFLLKESDPEINKLLNKYIEGTLIANNTDSRAAYIIPEEVVIINNAIRNVQLDSLKIFYNNEKMIENDIYRGGWFTLESWEYIKQHIVTMQEAFAKAAEHKDCIVIYFS